MAERGKGNWSSLAFQYSYHFQSPLSRALFKSQTFDNLNWTKISYPKEGEESQSLESIRQAIRAKRNENNPVSSVIVEPTSYYLGTTFSDSYLNELYGIAKENEAALIIDERNTGCGASGKGFWQYSGPSDYLVFGKRTQVEGFFSSEASQKHSISVGTDALSLFRFKVIKQTLDQSKLIDKVKKVGVHAQTVLSSAIERSGSGLSLKGNGTSFVISTDGEEKTLRLLKHMREHGVLVNHNCAHSISIRPTLIFEDKHAD